MNLRKQIEMKKEIARREIKIVKDLLKACNGDYALFGETIKNYLICKGGKLMTWEDWYKKPHPSISETIDADYEIIEVKQLPNSEQGVERSTPTQSESGNKSRQKK